MKTSKAFKPNPVQEAFSSHRRRLEERGVRPAVIIRAIDPILMEMIAAFQDFKDFSLTSPEAVKQAARDWNDRYTDLRTASYFLEDLIGSMEYRILHIEEPDDFDEAPDSDGPACRRCREDFEAMIGRFDRTRNNKIHSLLCMIHVFINNVHSTAWGPREGRRAFIREALPRYAEALRKWDERVKRMLPDPETDALRSVN